ncbi:multiple sugar transport system substrate-binding protein [Mobilisporobacter senegalensis]|uniref:Multiple sugar transport system substrate-binding protein n=1 Tax=Mobilisporobacter senegalensis TaxID=1329262 RepID=A0A3N1XYV3_9FIRM|nr:extracellular solute-binding protein [Mobilisporobacter senegalensis]ROR30422.1 multiple sugar transport system substrate-binding protein [Mobilisporobacter senegalensis]
MKLRKVTALLLAGIMALSLAACGKTDGKTDEPAASKEEVKTEDTASDEPAKLEGKLVIWTLAEDLKAFADKFMEKNPGVEVETVVIAPADYPTKLTAALRGKAKEPDIIVGEPQMLPDFFEAGFFEDLSQEPYGAEQYKDLIVDYIYEAGRDSEGKVRALSYQATPGGIYYRRDIAQKIWGNEDPAFVSEKFKDYNTIAATAVEVKNAGYRIFGDTGNLRWFPNGGGAWVQDNKLVLSQDRLDYMDAAVKLYQDKLVAFSPEWSAAWYASMSGPIPVNAEWAAAEDLEGLGGDKTEVFAYALPSWGSLIVRDNAGDNAGSFGVASGPCSFFGGGTFVGISSHSERKELAWEFVKFTTLDEETAKWWTDVSKGDIVSMKSVLESVKDVENETYGKQKTYAYFLNEAQNIDYSLITRYDTQIGNYWGAAIEAVQKGDKTKEQAIDEFYTNVQSIYPELEITK